MMTQIRLIDIKKDILAENRMEADEIRQKLRGNGVFMLNVMSSPGSGKTSLLLRTIAALGKELRMGVIEGDIESSVDAEKIARTGTPAVQLRTGGACHLDAPMIGAALNELNLAELDLVIIENVGNLVCPAEFDTGSTLSAVILSVPEGDDKPLKYPLIFTVCQVLIINKTDYLEGSDFDLAALKDRVYRLNPEIRIVEVSCKTGNGMESWTDLLRKEVADNRD
ncbi:MAG: hydrogenase nickel incorporation protein HypB [Smithellaceae bacterium]|nr:hydrogenase nickel incorporation protein HypB [Smithellaceae bacterium]